MGTPGASPETAASTAAATAARAAKAGAEEDDAMRAGLEAARKDNGTSVAGTVLSQLVKYVPTETISVYLAVQAALGSATAPSGKQVCDASFVSHWIWLGVLAVATALLAIGLAYRSQRQMAPNQGFTFTCPIVEPVAAVAAFLVWALSLPTTPLKDMCGYQAEAWGPVLVLGGTTVISTVAYVFGKTITWQKVLQEER
ncbi:hypothetical protein ACFY3M_43435 [Streptomyces mirabilis]|uniref:hypothetical protein n=1 Tax=Streptomyces mirabilis TaxID=68239 RepID=UPI0036B6FFFB